MGPSLTHHAREPLLNDVAMAALAAPREGGNATLIFVIQMVAIFAIFYFLLIRPQKKAQQRHQEMVAGLKKGDNVMTDGGIVGQVIHLKEDRVTVKTASDTRIEVARGKIARVFGAEGDET